MPLAHFAHLHVHSHYTRLGATASIPELVTQAAADGLTHLALTDTNVLYGAVEFAQACTAAGIQPIVGMMAHLAAPEIAGSRATAQPDPIVLLATGLSGYRSLCRLSSLIQASPERAQLSVRPGAPGIAWATLKAHREGLLCLAGGRRSYLERCLRAGDLKAASTYLSRIGGLFDECAYLALELHQPDDLKIAQAVVKLGERFGLPCVAVQPLYCLAPADRPRLRLLAAIDRHCTLDEVPVAGLPYEADPAIDIHWLHPAEMSQRFAALPAALAAIHEITGHCKFALPNGRPIWPVLTLPENITPDAVLTTQVEKGLRDHYREPDRPDIGQRLAAELSVIAQRGYAPLFLLLADLVRFAHTQQLVFSASGSLANSLVAYCLGITTVDPLRYNLLFEHLLTLERTNLPAIELDFCDVRRDEVLEYVRQTYDADKVALVATLGALDPSSALAETAKAYSMADAVLTKIIKRLADKWPPAAQPGHSLPEEVLTELETPEQRTVVSAAYPLIGQPHHWNSHSGSVVVTPGPLTDFVPVQRAPNGWLITQLTHEQLVAIGLPVMTLLGSHALTVLAAAAALVRQHDDPSFQWENIPLDDAATATLLASGETVGVFPYESNDARRTLRQLKACTVQDLAVANALFRPRAATSELAATFMRRYRGEEPTSYLHPRLEPILGFTQGVLIFQEQLLRIAHDLAGLSWAEADNIGQALSRRSPQALVKLQTRFLAGCQRAAPTGPALTLAQAKALWEQLLALADDGYSQGQATAAAAVSYRAAYLKAHWPAALLAAQLATGGGFHHPAIYLAEALQLGIAVRPPHINQSLHHCTLGIEKDDAGQPHPVLWLGLGQVHGLRDEVAQAIITQRQQQPFTHVADLLTRVPLQPKELTHLIQCGALDGLGASRTALLSEVKESRQPYKRHQLAFDFGQPLVEAEPLAQRLAWERRLLGLPVTVHPLAIAIFDRQRLPSLAQAKSAPGQLVKVAVTRLPGLTGDPGFFVGDGQTYSTAIVHKKLPAPAVWTPILATGRWQQDEWGDGWLQLEAVENLAVE